MYLSKNSRYVIQKTWLSSHLVRHCFTQISRNYSSKVPKEDPGKPALRLNVPKDPPIDSQMNLYLLKGCVETEKLKNPVEKSTTSRDISQDHLNEINMLLNPPNLLLNENVDKDAVRKAMSTESLKSRSSAQNSSSVTKIPRKTHSHTDIEAKKKIYESNIPKLKKQSSKERKIVKEVQNVQTKPVQLIKESKKSKSDIFLELRKVPKDKKMESKKAKSVENIMKALLRKDLVKEKKDVKNELKVAHRTKAQENFDNKHLVSDSVAEKGAKPVQLSHLDNKNVTLPIKEVKSVESSNLDNKNMSLPVKDDYLTAALENAIPKTKTVEVKMKFRVRIDRIGNPEKQPVDEEIESAELAYEVVSDDTKPKSPKTIKTEKVVKDVMKTIVHKARDVLEDKRLQKNLKKERKMQMVKIHDVPEKKFYDEVIPSEKGAGSKFSKQLAPFEVSEFDDKNKSLALKRFPAPKTRLEKAVSYHGKLSGGSKIQRQYLLNDRFHLPTGDGPDFISNIPRSPTNAQRILKPLGSQITMIDDVPEYLRYPEFKYVGLSSTASRNFHNTSTREKFKNDNSFKRPAMIMESVIKSRENLVSLKSTKDMLVNRTVSSFRSQHQKPIHMAIPIRVRRTEDDDKCAKGKTEKTKSKTNMMPPPMKVPRKYANRFNRQPCFKDNKNSSLNDAKLKLAPPTNEKQLQPEILLENPKTHVVSNGSRYQGIESGFLGKESKTEESLKNGSTLGVLMEKNKHEPCCEEDITNIIKRDEQVKKPVKKKRSDLEGSYGYRDITQYKKDGLEKNIKKEKPCADDKKKKTCPIPNEFELNLSCVKKSVSKEPPEKILKCSAPMKRRQRSFVHKPKPKPKIMNVMKPPSTPKMSDNFVNVANESLTKGKVIPSVDSLRMMEKVKKMLDFDLKNAEKIFTHEEKIVPSVVRLVEEPWKWEVSKEDLNKWELGKVPKNITSEVSVVCLSKENEWKVIDFPKRKELNEMRNEKGSVMHLDSKSKSSKTGDQSSEKKPKKVEKSEKEGKAVEQKKMNVKSVVAFNPDADNFQIVKSELTECQKNSKVDLDPVTYDASAVKHQGKSKGVSAVSLNEKEKFEVNKEALESFKKVETPINYQKVEDKKGSSAILYDEKNASWKVDLPLDTEQGNNLETLELTKVSVEEPKATEGSNEAKLEIPNIPKSPFENDQALCEGKKDDTTEDTSGTPVTSTEPTKKEHYVSNKILEMTKNNQTEKSSTPKPNIGETIKVDISSAEHSPSKITEINLNKEAQKNKLEVNPAESCKIPESKPFYKNFEKYQTPYSEPDYEENPVKINTDMKSNPNMKKLDGSNKTLVLHDMSKPSETIDNWLKDETDKMANLLIKVLQDASEAKSKRKVLRSKLNEKYLKNVHDSFKKKENFGEEQKTSCKIPERKRVRKSKPQSVSEIPLQSAKNVEPPKTVDAVDMNHMSAFDESLKESSIKINQEVFEVSEGVIDPIGINADNLPDLNLKKITLPERLLKMKPEQVKKLLRIPEVPVKPVIGSPLKEIMGDVEKEGEIDIPGPEGLKKWSLVWKYLPAVGCQATVWIFQLAQIGASMFGTYNSSKVHSRIFDNLFTKYGPIVKLPGPLGGEVLLINRPEHIKAIFDQEGKHSVRSIFDSVDKCRILSQSKSTSFVSFEDWKGEEWEEIRKTLISPTLNTEKYFDYFQEAGKLLVRRIATNRNNHSLTSEDFMDDIKRYSLECLCYVVFDKPLGFLNFNTLDWSVESNRLMKHLSDATDCILKCETGFQIWRFVDTPSSVVLSNACQSLESIIGKHVRQAEMNLSKKKADLASGKIKASDLSFIEHTLLIDGMNYDEVVYTIMDMLLIGVNTTSCALGFLLYRLAQNSRVQRMLLKEIRNVLPAKTSDLNYHRLHSLKYLQACLKESLRLNAPMPLLIRNLHYDIALPEYRVPKGTFVVMDTQAQCMKEHNFEDSEKYFPERWFDPGLLNFATIPFCHGNKAEIGRRLSEIQIWSCVAQMLRNFKIEYNYGDIKGTDEVISFPDKPLKLSFIDREE